MASRASGVDTHFTELQGEDRQVLIEGIEHAKDGAETEPLERVWLPVEDEDQYVLAMVSARRNTGEVTLTRLHAPNQVNLKPTVSKKVFDSARPAPSGDLDTTMVDDLVHLKELSDETMLREYHPGPEPHVLRAISPSPEPRRPSGHHRLPRPDHRPRPASLTASRPRRWQTRCDSATSRRRRPSSPTSATTC